MSGGGGMRRAAVVASLISAALSFPAEGIAERADLLLPAALGTTCGPRPDVERALMNAGYRRIWRGTSDAAGSPTMLWETPTRDWLITTTRDDAHICIADFGWQSSRR